MTHKYSYGVSVSQKRRKYDSARCGACALSSNMRSSKQSPAPIASSFSKTSVFTRPHVNARSAFSKTSVFTCPHVHAKTAFSKTSTLESVFENLRFHSPKTPFTCGRNAKTEEKTFVFKNTAYVWTEPKSKMYVVLKPSYNIQAFEYYTCWVVYFSNLLVSKILIFSISVGCLWCGYSDDIQITSPFSCGLFI